MRGTYDGLERIGQLWLKRGVLSAGGKIEHPRHELTCVFEILPRRLFCELTLAIEEFRRGAACGECPQRVHFGLEVALRQGNEPLGNRDGVLHPAVAELCPRLHGAIIAIQPRAEIRSQRLACGGVLHPANSIIRHRSPHQFDLKL